MKKYLDLGPRNAEEEIVFKQIALENKLYHELHRLKQEHNMSRREMSKVLGCSISHVDKLLARRANLTTRSIAKIFFLLGYDVDIVLTPIVKTV